MRNICGMSVGRGLVNHTTAELTALVTKFGPTGTQEANAIPLGALAYDTTVSKVKYYNGTDFVLITA